METMNQKTEEYEIDSTELEAEGYHEDYPVDSIYVLDGRGRVVMLEVPDDD